MHLADYLYQDGLITRELADAAEKQTLPVISFLVRTNILSSQTLLEYGAAKFALPIYDLSQRIAATELFTENFILANRIVIIKQEDAYLYVGMSDPTDSKLIRRLSFYAERHVIVMLVDENQLESYLQQQSATDKLTKQLHSTLAHLPLANTPPDRMSDDEDEPVSLFVTELLNDARTKQVSDIHLEPQEENCVIRFRRDGLLMMAATIPPHLAARVITRLKIMANLDIGERRLPQDGRIKTFVDIRVNTCPALYGEKMVLRLLDGSSMQRDLRQLGMDEHQLALIYAALAKPQGMIIVTGPTGSGKTVTLYSALADLNHVQRNILTIEDPVEITLPGINQINVNAEIGLGFAEVLRAIMRQDPDVIMIGEIRDRETATIALQAAQTGHLVLTTLHANNAEETIVRLESMGIEKHYLLGAISLVIAQRLVRLLCEKCKVPDRERPGFYQAAGCESCYLGYKGRTGIFECMPNGATNFRKLHESTLANITSHTEWIRVFGAPPWAY